MLNSEQLNEETNPFAGTPEGFVGIEDSATRDYLNALIAGITAGHFLTPYIALERVSKVLANYQIFPPRTSFLEGDSGSAIWPVNQFGSKFGMNNDGEVGYAPTSNYSIYFEYRMSDGGMYVIYCEVVNQDELDEILADVEDEMNYDGEDDINEATLAGPETGTHKIPGASKNVKSPASEYPPPTEEEEDKMELDENYHASYTDAIQTAVNTAKKRGYEVDSDDYQNKVSSGPRKPSEGKTVSHNLKLTKDGKPTKKGLSIQVYNRGGDKSPFELNHYISEEVEGIDEISSAKLISYSQKAHQQIKGNQPADPDKLRKRTNREQGIKLAFNKHYQFRTKVPATVSTNEEVTLDEAGSYASFHKETGKIGYIGNKTGMIKHVKSNSDHERGYTGPNKKVGDIFGGYPKKTVKKEELDLDEVVTKRKMTSKELVARAAYLSKHKEKLAAADTGIKATKSYKDISGERGDYTSEPSKMRSAPKSSSKYLDIKEDKPPFPGPYEKKGEAKDKNVAKNMARKAMKAAVEKAKSKKK